MHFPRFLVLLFTASVVSVAIAGPIPRFFDGNNELAGRDEEFALERRLTSAQIGQAASEVVKKQDGKKQTKANQVKPKVPRANWKAQKKAAHQAKANTPAQKQAKKAAQTLRRQQRLPGQKGPATTAKKVKTPSAADKLQVKTHMRNTGAAYRNIADKPAKTDRFTHGGVSRTGKDARIALFNSKLHEAAPVGGGHGGSSMPKHFGNYPPSPLPGAPSGSRSGLKEYPVKSGSPAGYQGNGDKGKVRVVAGAAKFEGVVTHPSGARSGAHVKMNQTT